MAPACADAVKVIGHSTCLYAMHRDELEYETEIRRQRGELAELSAERRRLLEMQQHLLKLQETLAAATTAATQVNISLSIPSSPTRSI